MTKEVTCVIVGQKIDDHGVVIPDPEEDALQAALEALNAAVNADNAHAARPITLSEYNRPDQFYANRYAIRPHAFQRHDFELNPDYFTLVGHTPFHGLSHEHRMDHLERF